MKTKTKRIYIMRSKLGRNGPKPKRVQSPAVTGSRFREMRLSCGISVPVAAKELRCSERTVHNWETGRVRVPYAAYKLLRILRGWELPHAAFKGWRLLPDRLVTPEGHAIWPHQFAWWSLTCRMASQFRAMTLRPAVAGTGAAETHRTAQDGALALAGMCAIASGHAPPVTVPGAIPPLIRPATMTSGIYAAIDPPHPDGVHALHGVQPTATPSSNTGFMDCTANRIFSPVHAQGVQA